MFHKKQLGICKNYSTQQWVEYWIGAVNTIALNKEVSHRVAGNLYQHVFHALLDLNDPHTVKAICDQLSADAIPALAKPHINTDANVLLLNALFGAPEKQASLLEHGLHIDASFIRCDEKNQQFVYPKLCDKAIAYLLSRSKLTYWEAAILPCATTDANTLVGSKKCHELFTKYPLGSRNWKSQPANRLLGRAEVEAKLVSVALGLHNTEEWVLDVVNNRKDWTYKQAKIIVNGWTRLGRKNSPPAPFVPELLGQYLEQFTNELTKDDTIQLLAPLLTPDQLLTAVDHAPEKAGSSWLMFSSRETCFSAAATNPQVMAQKAWGTYFTSLLDCRFEGVQDLSNLAALLKKEKMSCGQFISDLIGNSHFELDGRDMALALTLSDLSDDAKLYIQNQLAELGFNGDLPSIGPLYWCWSKRLEGLLEGPQKLTLADLIKLERYAAWIAKQRPRSPTSLAGLPKAFREQLCANQNAILEELKGAPKDPVHDLLRVLVAGVKLPKKIPDQVKSAIDRQPLVSGQIVGRLWTQSTDLNNLINVPKDDEYRPFVHALLKGVIYRPGPYASEGRWDMAHQIPRINTWELYAIAVSRNPIDATGFGRLGELRTDSQLGADQARKQCLPTQEVGYFPLSNMKPPGTNPSLCGLPKDVLIHCLLNLTGEEVSRTGGVCKWLREVVTTNRYPSLWQRLCTRDFPNTAKGKGTIVLYRTFILQLRLKEIR